MEDLKRAANRGVLTSHGNSKAIAHTLSYFEEVYGISFNNDDIARGGISDYRIAEFHAICNQIQSSGVLEKGNQAFAIKRQMAERFEQFVECATSSQSIINYFSNFSVIEPTHITEAQILLDSNNPHAMLALQVLITNGAIKGNLDGLGTKTELKRLELNIVRQYVQETWKLKCIHAQHTR